MASEAAATDSKIPPPMVDTAKSLLEDWGKVLTAATEQTEKFTKEKPLVALAAAFTAGIVFDELMGALFRRRSR